MYKLRVWSTIVRLVVLVNYSVGALYDSSAILGCSLVYPPLVLGNEAEDKPKNYRG